MTGAGGGAQSWPLRGSWRVWLWVSALLGAVFVIGGVAIVGIIGFAALVPAVVLVLVGAMITWQVLHTATGVTLAADGALVLQRVRGPVRTHTARVRRARPSKLKSSYTPTVIETEDGWAYLVHTRSERDTLIAAMRRHNAQIAGGG